MSSPGSDRRVFVDTSAFFAAASRRDANHAAASAAMAHLILDRFHVVTTNFVLAELHALALARGTAADALGIVRRIRQSPAATIVRVRTRDEERAWEIIQQYDDKGFSLTDALSFAVMERMLLLGQDQGAGDMHFHAAGSRALQA